MLIRQKKIRTSSALLTIRGRRTSSVPVTIRERRTRRMKMQTKYCNLISQEQQKQQDLLKRIQELEADVSNKHEEEEVKLEFKNRDKLRMSMMNWNEFEEDFEEYDETTEEDQINKINKLELEVKRKAAEVEDMEKENLDSRVVMISEYKEQMKMIDFFKDIISTQISKGELEQLRIQSKWSDKDNEFKVPLFYAKHGKVNPLRLPKHEVMLKLSELYESRSLKLKTDHMVKHVDVDLDSNETLLLNDNFCKNQPVDSAFCKSKLIEHDVPKNRIAMSHVSDKYGQKLKKHRLPPVKHE